jgi:hypothetical protein
MTFFGFLIACSILFTSLSVESYNNLYGELLVLSTSSCNFVHCSRIIRKACTQVEMFLMIRIIIIIMVRLSLSLEDSVHRHMMTCLGISSWLSSAQQLKVFTKPIFFILIIMFHILHSSSSWLYRHQFSHKNVFNDIHDPNDKQAFNH